jgi:hypothetical protein
VLQWKHMAIFVNINGWIQGLLWVYFKTDWDMEGLMSHDLGLNYLSWCYLLAVWDSISNFNVILLLFIFSMIQTMPCLLSWSTKRRRKNLRNLHLDLPNRNCLCLKIQGWVYIVCLYIVYKTLLRFLVRTNIWSTLTILLCIWS